MTSDPRNKALTIPHDHICSGRFQAPSDRCWDGSRACQAQPAQTPLKFLVTFPKELDKETNVENRSVWRSLK